MSWFHTQNSHKGNNVTNRNNSLKFNWQISWILLGMWRLIHENPDTSASMSINCFINVEILFVLVFVKNHISNYILETLIFIATIVINMRVHRLWKYKHQRVNIFQHYHFSSYKWKVGDACQLQSMGRRGNASGDGYVDSSFICLVSCQ